MANTVAQPFHPSTLCRAILEGTFAPSDLFDASLSPAQHREAVMHALCLQSLLTRSLPFLSLPSLTPSLSPEYFVRLSSLTHGSYFLLSSAWLSVWRAWARGEVDYANVSEMAPLRLCAHGNTVIPGYMYHFITGVSSVPCAVGSSFAADA